MGKKTVKNILCFGLAFAMTCSLMIGIAPGGAVTTKAAEVFEPTDEMMSEMVQDSLYSKGNNARVKSVIAKARAGETVSLAYIGGSITEGANATPNAKCYAQVSATAFAQKYGKDGGSNVHFVNAGMSGTPSDIGVVRYQRDVIRRLPEGQDHPDILFIEFAVNDWGCETGGGAYEGLIREALGSGSAVVLIFSIFRNQNTVCESDYRKYGEHYDLPMVSMGNAISKYYNSGFDTWYGTAVDGYHPNNTGHQFMADCVMNLVDTLDQEEAETDNITDVDSITPLKTDAYQGIRMIDQSTDPGSVNAITSIDAGGFTEKDTETSIFQYEYNGQMGAAWFPNNWMHTSDSGEAPLKISVNCKTLMLVYKLSGSSQFGSADLYVDGEKKATLNGTGGWNNGKVYLALEEQEVAAHEIELKMADGNASKNFTLLAIGYKGLPESSSSTQEPTTQKPSTQEPDKKTDAGVETPKPTPEPTVKKPGKPVIKKLTNKKGKKVTVKLKKKVSGAAGYQVAYATKSSMKGQKKKSFKGTSVTVKGLKKKKTYYFRVRAYKTVNGKKLYGNWGKKKKIKIRK